MYSPAWQLKALKLIFHSYADDTQLNGAIKPIDYSVSPVFKLLKGWGQTLILLTIVPLTSKISWTFLPLCVLCTWPANPFLLEGVLGHFCSQESVLFLSLETVWKVWFPSIFPSNKLPCHQIPMPAFMAHCLYLYKLVGLSLRFGSMDNGSHDYLYVKVINLKRVITTLQFPSAL